MGRKRKFRDWALLDDGRVVRWSKYTASHLHDRIVQVVQAHTLKEAETKIENIKDDIPF